MNKIKILQNVGLTGLMVVSVPLAILGSTYLYGLVLLVLTVALSLYLLFVSKHEKNHNQKITWLVLVLWSSIPLSFFLAFFVPLFGEGLDGLSNWAKFSLALGSLAMVLTAVRLFQINR